MTTRILILAAHLQPFLVSGLQAVLKHHDVSILVYAKRREENELLDIQTGERFRIFTYNDEPEVFFWKEIDHFQPHLVYSAGWMFRLYLSWCAALKRSGAKTICAMDTQWKGSLKQKLFVLIAPLSIRKCFTHIWVPGRRQLVYARKLGFLPEQTLHHLYAPDVHLFEQAFFASREQQHSRFTRKFLYVGRLEPHKLENLLRTYRSLPADLRKDWPLQVIGNGSMRDSPLLQAPGIQYLPALPQRELAKLAAEKGVFCLCSKDEPWGTVVQEFAAAGFPLLLSEQCGSSDHFLEDNGMLCDGSDTDSIRNGLLQFINTTEEVLLRMSEKSHALGAATDSWVWAAELMKVG